MYAARNYNLFRMVPELLGWLYFSKQSLQLFHFPRKQIGSDNLDLLNGLVWWNS
jgi:hypothetical protein